MPSLETAPRGEVLNLFTTEYATRFGFKEIKLNGQRYLVHDTSDLPHLITAAFHELAGIQPQDFKEQAFAAKLTDPIIHHLINELLDDDPDFTNVLGEITLKRDQEADVRRRIRLGEKVGLAFSQAQPSDAELDKRDFVYSQAFDRLGDIAYRSGLQFDLEKLL